MLHVCKLMWSSWKLAEDQVQLYCGEAHETQCLTEQN